MHKFSYKSFPHLFPVAASVLAFGAGIYTASADSIDLIAPDIRPVLAEECALMIDKGVITRDNPVPCERLSRITFQHHDLEGGSAEGAVVVFDGVAQQTAQLLQALFQAGFPINKAAPVEAYDGDDDASMADNNSSSFNGRVTTGGSSWSKHAYGVALDINPLQNPYLSIKETGVAQIKPVGAARKFVNRIEPRPGKDNRPGLIDNYAELFARHGYMTWGGDWNFPIDYQHFEIGSRSFIEEIVAATPDEAGLLFNAYATSYRNCAEDSPETDPVKRRAACIDQVAK